MMDAARGGLFIIFVVYFADHLAHGRVMKVGLLLELDNCCSFMSFENSVGAISIAQDALKADGIWTENMSFEWRHAVGTNEGVAKVVELIRDSNVDLILGSPSSIPTIPAAHLTAEWQFPHMSWAAASYELSNKDVYRTFIRTRGSISSWGYLVVSLFDKLGWKQLGMVFVNHRLCKYCADGLLASIAERNITVTSTVRIPYDEYIPNSVVDTYFIRLKKASRIIYLCVDLSDLRRYLIRACLLGMCEGDYVFIFPQYDFVQENIVIKGDGLDQLAKQGFRHVILITMATWFEETGRLKREQFQRQVIERASEHPWLNTDANRLNESASSVAPFLYNSIYMYGLWLNHTTQHGLDPRNGTGLMEFSKGLSFDGIAGPVLFQDDGDCLPLLWVSQFTGDNMTAQVVLDPGYQSTFNVNPIVWYTNNGQPPTDAPACGFFNEFCTLVTYKDNHQYIVLSVTIVSVFIVAVVAIFAIVVFRRRKLVKASWKIDPKAVVRVDVKKGLTSEANLRSEMSMSIARSFQSSYTESGGHNLKTAMYNGNTVVIRSVRPSVILRLADIQELEKMKDMIYVNINPFIGACFDPPNPMMLFQYCSKGCLQDMLENTDIALDKTLVKSLIYDLVLGVKYIHDSPLESHGRLKSTNCMIDERWTLKITDYGINNFVVNDDPDMHESEKFKGMLWTAPEILDSPELYKKGSKPGDVYSLAIILHEIVFRMGVFAGWEEMTSEEVVRHVRNREVTPMRPRIFSKTSIASASPLIDLMKACWSDDPTKRPLTSTIRRSVAKILKISEGGNFAEVVQKRLMKYAENLETIVNRRTQMLMEEKQKTEMLLYRMLPKSVADKLKAGFPVHPEEFESATVYFSDIVGFTAIAGESTPMQVVDFLNDLYSKLDALIGKYDAYKVETIGDAYMVVSGVPVKNGDKHTAIIADMALSIKETVCSFHIQHLPSKVLQLRSGFHTGPCCAGVVGLSMPKYCLFGDTVNVASRMESHGEGQKIHISHQAYTQLIQLGSYTCELRAELDIKGKGKMKTYWLTGGPGRKGSTIPTIQASPVKLKPVGGPDIAGSAAPTVQASPAKLKPVGGPDMAGSAAPTRPITRSKFEPRNPITVTDLCG